MSGLKTKLKNNKVVFGAYKKVLKTRRKALSLLSPVAPVFVSKQLYKATFNQKLNLDEPKYFNEKLMWLKLNKYANDPLVIQCSDKYAVREYIESCGLGETLNELYGVWDNAKDIDWSVLPDRFAMKCNHGCGYNLICRDKSKLDIPASVKKLNKWMASDSWKEYAELHYRKIPKKIICEKFIEGKDGALPVDYKIYCFNGKPLYIGNFIERNMSEGTIIRGYFNLDWTPSDVFRYPMDPTKFEKPAQLEKMLEYAEILSKPFPFVRVDFYEANGQIIFGELTFTPTGCLGAYYSDEAHVKLGQALKIENK